MGAIKPFRQTREGRQHMSRTAPQCACGNTAAKGGTQCAACHERDQAEVERARKRDEKSADQAGLELLLFHFFERKYVQRADARQRQMGLQYMEVETHDLAEEVSRFVLSLDLDGLGDRLELPKTGARCAECNELQIWTASGVTCLNGHGGAESV